MVMRREIALEGHDDDGAVRYVEHYMDADGSSCDDSVATHFVGHYVDAEGRTVRKAWGRVTKDRGPEAPTGD